MIKVGIPRALFYYYYFPLWKDFFQNLGVKVVLSSPTNKNIVNNGVAMAVDEACLPVKLYYGHVLDLADKVDAIFLPRLVSTAHREFICPKFMGLPDMIKSSGIKLPQLIEVDIDLSRNKKAMRKAALEMGKHITGSTIRILKAWNLATISQRQFEYIQRSDGELTPRALELWTEENGNAAREMQQGIPKVALLGHGYNVYDRYVSMDIIHKLQKMGAAVITAENVPDSIIEEEAARLPKRMFWTLGKRQIGAAFHFMKRPDVKGLIHIASFGCGPDSLVGELIERHMRRAKTVPFLFLTIDEHTGQAGIVTRLEAFWDMIEWRDAQCQ